MGGDDFAQAAAPQDRRKGFFDWLWNGRAGGGKPWARRIVSVLFFFALPAPVVLLLMLRFLPVPFTPSMLGDLVTLHGVHYAWRDAGAISPFLARAVIGSEDQNFCTHDGFDWKAIDDAWRDYKFRHKPLRGASTISQQTAREVFLAYSGGIVRKALEAYLTVLVEALWPKKRIMTVYLNVVDWGHGNFGAEAAAQSYFGVSAAALNPAQAARLAAILPSPDKWKAVHPGRYVRRRTGALVARQGQVVANALDWCVH
ncbi:MAG: monofunctional biosynthetic peptidoglycan transglycosylase [Rhizomicrobium sp.]